MPVTKVLAAFFADVTAERYGLDLMRETGLASGSLYPILIRLTEAGWVEPHWEQVDPAEAGRPPRKYYRLTPEGAARSAEAVRSLRGKRSPATEASLAW